MSERAVALIDVADPGFRDELLEAAVANGLVDPKQRLRSRTAYPVAEVRERRLRDGREVQIRPTRTSDAAAMQELFYRLSEDDVRTRFFQKLTSLTDTAAQHLCSVDYEEEMAFAAVVGPSTRERVVGASTYFLNPGTGLAEVAYVVDPEWQGAGLGTAMHAILVDYAREHGAQGLTADVLTGNSPMLRVFERGDHAYDAEADADVTEVTMRL